MAHDAHTALSVLDAGRYRRFCASRVDEERGGRETENAGVENEGADNRGRKSQSKPYGTPTRDYIEKNLSYFVRLVLRPTLLTE